MGYVLSHPVPVSVTEAVGGPNFTLNGGSENRVGPGAETHPGSRCSVRSKLLHTFAPLLRERNPGRSTGG